MARQLHELPELLKLEHSLLALPFAFIGAFLAARGLPDPGTCLLIAAAMICARTAGMSFNRVLDADIDALNPRTRDRAVPAGRVSRTAVWALGFLCLAGLSTCAWFLGPLCFKLSFLCHVLLIGYSLTKRFTWGCHLFLGLVEAFAPIGGWIAVSGEADHPTPWLLGLATITWIAGLDIVYATQDEDYDRDKRLHSIPARFGTRASFMLSRLCHMLTVLLLGAAGWFYAAGVAYWTGLAAVSLLFIYQHSLVSPSRQERLNFAFFGVNTWISLTLMATTLIETWWGGF